MSATLMSLRVLEAHLVDRDDELMVAIPTWTRQSLKALRRVDPRLRPPNRHALAPFELHVRVSNSTREPSTTLGRIDQLLILDT